MKVTKHFIGAPSAKELDNIRVNLGTKEGGGSAGTEGPGGDLVWEETEIEADKFNSIT